VFGGGKRTDKIITRITEWFWKFAVDYELSIYPSNRPDDRVVLQKRSGHCEIMTPGELGLPEQKRLDRTPRAKRYVRDAIDVNITWLFEQISSDTSKLKFAIDRSRKDCHTPRRNSDISNALSHFSQFYSWSTRIHSYFTSDLFPAQQNNALDMTALNVKTIFVPVVPLFEERAAEMAAAIEEGAKGSDALVPVGTTGAKASKAVLPIGDVNLFLDEQKRSLTAKCVELAAIFPQEEKLVTMAEATICVAVLHAKQIGQYHLDGVEYIEDMLRKQIIAAIGKEVQPVDFANYMVYHNRKVFKEQYQPQPFCYAVRRPDHYPEGVVSIEAQLADGSMPEPINTIVSKTEARSPIKFAIHAAATVSFTGDAYLHAFVDHKFSGSSGVSLSLNARARQFSSFLVLVGKVTGPGLFQPRYGMIVKDKDDITIPLQTETLPSPKEFSDAISSLSPEQQRFARAFRSMQLASTLFAVCILQIKPQLEKLLKLPYDALTKEIQLTQDLQEMFIKYQIPSDLMSFGGAPNTNDAAKLSAVKGHVKAMQEMIESSKQKELNESAQKAVYAVLSNESAPPRPAGMLVPRDGAGGGGSGSGSSSKSGAATHKQPTADKPVPAGVVDFSNIPAEVKTCCLCWFFSLKIFL
jgi:hypothetical protein